MSLWSRFKHVFRGERLNRELNEEFDSHLAEAIENGRDPDEARRALGSALRNRERSRDIKLIPWLDSLRSDMVVGWRQLARNKAVSAAAILSLGLAIGACTSAFRLIDALLLRPLPVAHPERLYMAVRKTSLFNSSYQYHAVNRMRDAVKNDAELIALASPQRMDLTYGSDQDTEKAFVQYVSGSMFPAFGLRPAIGRLLGESDDDKPGAHPFAVLSYDYWTRRFQRDPNIIGRTIKMRNDPMWMAPDLPSVFEVVGVAEDGFTGVGPGTVTDIFLPTMMHGAVRHPD